MLKVLRLGIAASLISVALVGCGRDISTPSKVLVGHWVALMHSSGEKIDYCFERDGNVTIRERSTDTIRRKPYIVEFESPKNRTIEVVIGDLGSLGYADRIVFARDSKSAQVFIGGRLAELIKKSNSSVEQVYQLTGEEPPKFTDQILQDWQYTSEDVSGCG